MRYLLYLFLLFPLITRADFSTGLVGYWPMDSRDYLNSTTIVDRSGHGYVGTLVASPTKVAGVISQALSFNGTSQYITTPFNIATVVGATGSFTISLWAYPTNVTNTARDVYDADTSGGSRFYLNIPDAISTTAKIGLGSWNPVETGVVVANQWHMWTIVLNGTTGYFYLDGVLEDSQAGITVSNPSATLNIAHLAGGTQTFYSGDVDDFRIYSRALSAAEINELYRQGEESKGQSTIIEDIIGNIGGMF